MFWLRKRGLKALDNVAEGVLHGVKYFGSIHKYSHCSNYKDFHGRHLTLRHRGKCDLITPHFCRKLGIVFFLL